MGMFDTLILDCPLCGSDVELQSKAGQCTLERYTLADVPPEILGDVLDESTRCYSCGATVSFGTQAQPAPLYKGTPKQMAFLEKHRFRWAFMESDGSLHIGAEGKPWDSAYVAEVKRTFPEARYLCLYGSPGNYSGTPLNGTTT